MTVTEESRHRLHQALDRTIGPEEATTLMEHLPPVGWADVATKTDVEDLRIATKKDLVQLEERMDHRFAMVEERMDHRFAMVEEQMDHRFAMVDERFANLDERFDKIDVQFAGLGQQITMLGEQMDRSDRRYEQLVVRIDRQFWQFIGLLLGITAIILAVAGAT